MTVNELIEALQSLPEECKDLEVWFQPAEEVPAQPVTTCVGKRAYFRPGADVLLLT